MAKISNMNNKLKIKIIGMGRFGSLLSKIIKANFPNFELNENISEADVVFPCVPISAFEDVIKDIKPKLKKTAIIIDICSVKIHPVKILKKHLANFEVIATHPMFGPDSAKNGLAGLKIMIFNVSAKNKTYSIFKKQLAKLKLKVIEITPEEHDKQMAFSQGYTHLIGRIGKEMKLTNTQIDTPGFEQTLKIQSYVVNDSEQLFLDMQRFNPYAKKMRMLFHKAIAKLDNKINLD